MKARKALQSKGQTADANKGDSGRIIADTMEPALQQQRQPQPHEATASVSGNPTAPAEVHHDVVATTLGEKRTHDGATKVRASSLEGLTPSDVLPARDQFERPSAAQSSVSWSSLLSSSFPAAAPTSSWPPPSPEARRSSSGDGNSPSLPATEHHGIDITTGRGEIAPTGTGTTDEGLEELDAEGGSGGGSEARGLRATSGDYACDDYGGGDGRAQHDDGMKAMAGPAGHYSGAGGMTVAIPPPLGSGAVDGHLRSPSEIMLDEIAESLADTSRKPSFARMQSVQVIIYSCVVYVVVVVVNVVTAAPCALCV